MEIPDRFIAKIVAAQVAWLLLKTWASQRCLQLLCRVNLPRCSAGYVCFGGVCLALNQPAPVLDSQKHHKTPKNHGFLDEIPDGS